MTLYSHALLISVKSKSQLMHKKVELKIPQLILAKIAQMGKHENINMRSEHNRPRVEGAVPVRGNFFAEFILL